MSDQVKSRTRAVIDASVAIALLSLAFWTGKLAQKVESMHSAGGVPIGERLSALEARAVDNSGRLDRIERKLDAMKAAR